MFAFRQLRKSPGFTLTAVLTLGLGIGATTTIFSIVEGVLLRPLPFHAPDRLVTLGDTLEGAAFDALPGPMVTAVEAVKYGSEAKSFSTVGAYQQAGYELSGAGDPALINAARLTTGVFQTLGVQPLLGRTFTEGEDKAGQRVAVVSYGAWHQRFHGDRNLLGKTILLDRKPYEVIGIMPREFEFPLVPGQMNRSELWVPISFGPAGLAEASSWNYRMVGRLKDGVTLQRARAEAGRVAQDVMRNFPAGMASLHIHAVVRPLHESTVSETLPQVQTLFLAVLVVLLIGCVNLAGLLLLRVVQRRREIAVRMALGADRISVLIQATVEALVLAAAGGLLGLVLASEALRVGVALLPESLPRISSIELDWHVVTFSILLAVLTAVFCSSMPAFAASRTDVNEGLREGSRTGSAGVRYGRVRAGLVTAEIAVALVLLTCSGLLLRSFEKLRAVELGLRTDHVLTAAYQLPKEQYATQTAIDLFNQALLVKLRRMPGVQTASVTSLLPAARQSSSAGFVVEGYVSPKGSSIMAAWPSQVLGSYFGSAGIPLLQGRDFTDADQQGLPHAVIVNRRLAEHYWPHENPIGKRLHWGLPEMPLPWMTVVGVVGDVKQFAADVATGDQIYQPAGQQRLSYGALAPPDLLVGKGGYIVLRTSLQPEQMKSELRAAVQSIDAQLPLTQLEALDQVVKDGQGSRRFNAALLSTFASAAVFIALLGIYSVSSFSAALRTREIAIRLVLGSPRQSIAGLVGPILASRLLSSLLFQIDALDSTVLGLAAIYALFAGAGSFRDSGLPRGIH